MGKKGKGTKKEDKPKKEVPQTAASKTKAMQEALEGHNVTISTPAPRPAAPPRTTVSKKSDRGGSAPTKIGCTESFRWDNSEKAPVLPPIGERIRHRVSSYGGRHRPDLFAVQVFHALQNWTQYLQWRCNGDRALLESASKSKTLKDGLSGPLSIASMIVQCMMYSRTQIGSLGALTALETGEPLHIVVVGATAVYEEKILRESDYWDELLAILSRRKVRLYLTGPEMSGKDGEVKRKRPGAEEGQEQEEDGPRVECWKTSAVDFFLKKGRLALFQKEDTVVVGLNCGFGVAARRMLNTPVAKQDQASNQALWNWIPTLHFIAALELPLMVTGCFEEESGFTRMVLEHVVGMYSLVGAASSPTPFESSISGQENEVRGNTFITIVQGQQGGHHFAAEPPHLGDNDPRLEELRKVAARTQSISSKKWPKGHKGVGEQASVLAPLKRYGNYPPEEREKGDHDHDDGGSESDVPVRAGRRKEQEKDKDKEGLLPPAVVKLKYSVVDEGPSSLKIIVEDVLMTDPATARVGMRRHRFALHYFDCQTLRDVVFEAALPKDVDHTTTQTTFRRSTASVTIVVRLLDAKI